MELGLLPGWIGSQQALGQVSLEAQSQQDDMGVGNSQDFLSLLNQFDPSENELMNPKDDYVGKSSDEVAAHIMDSEESDTVAVTPVLAVNSPLINVIQNPVYQKTELDSEQNIKTTEKLLDDLDRLRLKFFMQDHAIFTGAPEHKMAEYGMFINDSVPVTGETRSDGLVESSVPNITQGDPLPQKIALPKEFNLDPSSKDLSTYHLSQVERAYQQSSAANSDEISTIKYDRTKESYKPDNAIENFKIKDSVDSVDSVESSHALDESSHFIESLKRDFDDSTQDQDTKKNNQQSLDLKEPLDKSFDPRLMSVSAGINSKDAPQSVQSAGILDANYERIHQAAQLLVEKGGGSARIKLSPEGMGEIELRIRVQGDHVNVHFVAENVETKEIFEESIQNLKSQLEAQNLKVESLNIQIADVKSHNFADSGREHSQSNPNLGLLRDMMNQSRDESFARQSNTFSEWDSIRSYGRRAPSSPAPISSALETHAKINRYQGDRRGRRLSLVG